MDTQIIIAPFSLKSQMDPTCKLHSKSLKEDKSLEKCEFASKLLQKLMATFREKMSGRVHCFVESAVSTTTKSLLAAIKAKRGVTWDNNGLNPEINSMAVIIAWLNTFGNYNWWCGDEKNLSIVLWKALFQPPQISLEAAAAETETEGLNVEKGRMKFKVDQLHHRVQLLREVISQDDIDSVLTMVHY